MNIFAFSYSVTSLLMVVLCIIAFVTIQRKHRSRAKNLFVFLLIAVFLRLAGNVTQALFTDMNQEILATVGIYFGIFGAIIVFFFMVLFLNLILGEHRLKAPAIHTSIALIFATIALTIIPDIYSVNYNETVKAFVGLGHIIHTILLLLAGLVTNTIFLVFFIKQYNIVEKKFHKSITIMIIGNLFMGYIVFVLYLIRALIFPTHILLHFENISLGLGTIFMTLGFLLGGHTSLLGSSKLFYINIFQKNGLSVYHGKFTEAGKINEQLLSALATALSSFGNLVIGEEVFPEEIDYKDFAVLLYRYNDIIGFISCKYPSRQLKYGLKNIIESYKKDMSKDEITELLEKNLPYGKPIDVK